MKLRHAMAVGTGTSILAIVFIVSWFPVELGLQLHSQPIWKLVLVVAIAVGLLIYAYVDRMTRREVTK